MKGMSLSTEIMTVAQLIDQLTEYDGDTPVMIAVVKNPGEVDNKPIRWDWDSDTAVEVVPLSPDDVTMQHGTMVYLTVELAEYHPDHFTPQSADD